MQIVLTNVILSYPHLFEMHKFATDSDDKLDYSATFIFPADHDYTQLGQAIVAAATEQWPALVADPAFFPALATPYKLVRSEGPYKGFNQTKTARARKSKPQVLDQNLNPIVDRGLVGAGSRVNAQINLFGYVSPEGIYSIGMTLNILQLVETAGSPSLPSLGGEVQNPADHFTKIAGAPAPAAFPGAAVGAAPVPVAQTAGVAVPVAPPGGLLGPGAAVPVAPVYAAPVGVPVGVPAGVAAYPTIPAAPVPPVAPVAPLPVGAQPVPMLPPGTPAAVPAFPGALPPGFPQ